MNFKIVKSLVSGLKTFNGLIKSCRTASAPERLSLKRLQAKNYVSTISEDTWNKMSRSVFIQSSETNSKFLEKLQGMKKFYDSQGIKMPKDVEQAYQTLEHKATVFCNRLAVAQSEGKTPLNYWKYGDKFKVNNQEALDKVSSFAQKQKDDAYQKCHDMVFGNRAYTNAEYEKISQLAKDTEKATPEFSMFYSSDLYNPKIGEVSEQIIQKGQTFYHGTTKQGAILKNGFHLTPKRAQAVQTSRELGEAVYLTPDKKVASWFAGVKGAILPLKVNTKKIAAVNNNQQSLITTSIMQNLGVDALFDSARTELIIKELFTRNGYNAAYTRQALGNGLMSDMRKLVDTLVGGKQSQLAVFNPDDITILNRSFKDKLSNQAMQIRTVSQSLYNIYKMIKQRKTA